MQRSMLCISSSFLCSITCPPNWYTVCIHCERRGYFWTRMYICRCLCASLMPIQFEANVDWDTIYADYAKGGPGRSILVSGRSRSRCRCRLKSELRARSRIHSIRLPTHWKERNTQKTRQTVCLAFCCANCPICLVRLESLPPFGYSRIARTLPPAAHAARGFYRIEVAPLGRLWFN